VAARGGLVIAGSLVMVLSLGAGGAPASPSPDLLVTAKAASTVGPKVSRSAAPQATAPTGATGLASQPVPTSTLPVQTSPRPVQTSPRPVQAPPQPVQTQPPPADSPPVPLVVTVSASPDVVLVGQTVTYTAQVYGVPSGKHVFYNWAISGVSGVGQVSSTIHHSYSTPRDYPVAVTVTVKSSSALSGVATLVTHVVSPSKPSKVPGYGTSATGGGGSGSGRGTGNGSSSKPAASHVARARPHKPIIPSGVQNPLTGQARSPLAGARVEGFLLTDAGTPFVPPTPAAPTPGPDSSGGGGAGSAGIGGAAGVGGAVALTIAIVTLGALDERRRISLRHA